MSVTLLSDESILRSFILQLSSRELEAHCCKACDARRVHSVATPAAGGRTVDNLRTQAAYSHY